MLVKNAHGKTPLQNVLDSLVDNPDQESELSIFADELIRHGGFIHSHEKCERSEFQLTLQSFKTALTSNLSTLRAQKRIHLLLDAGYECSEMDVVEFEKLEMQTCDRCLVDRVYGTYMSDLKHLCRLKIRRSVRCPCVPWKLSQLPLPEFLLQYLNLL